MDTVLVVGGAGAIGSQLCSALYSRGYDVVCMDVLPDSETGTLKTLIGKPNFRYVRHSAMHPFRANCKYIYFMASVSSQIKASQYPVEAYRLETNGLFNTLEVARQNSSQVVYCSSSNVYAYGNGSYESSLYPVSHIKSAAEGICYAYHKEYGTAVRVARMFDAYGVGMRVDDNRIVPKMITSALQNKDIVITGSGSQQRTFCWAGDMVDGLIRFAEQQRDSKFEVLNFGGAEVITLDEIATKIIAMTHSRSKIVHQSIPNSYSEPLVADITKAQQLLGWQPQVSIDEGLSRMIEYLDKLLKIETSVYKCESWIEFN